MTSNRSSSHGLPNPPPTDHPRPSITSTLVISIGFGTFIIASIWPPILLVAATFLAAVVPQLFYQRDDGESRRRLYREFLKRDDLPEALKCSDVDLDEKYWVNSRWAIPIIEHVSFLDNWYGK